MQVRLVAADGRGGDVHPRVPVDLVQPQRRPLPELAVDGLMIRSAIRSAVAVEAECVPRVPRERQRPGDLGVDHQVLDAAARQASPRQPGLWPWLPSAAS